MAHERILIADDEAASRHQCRVCLEAAGYQVLEAADGNELVTLAQVHHPQLILVDLLMPGMDGFEAVIELQERPETSAIPILFLSTLNPEEILSQGVARFLTKPFEREDLIQAVRQVIPQSKAAAQILVVDDEKDIVEIVCDFLSDEGFQTTGVRDGREALDAIARHKPDAVVLDMKMPVLDGYDVIRFVKRHPQLKDLPIVVLTATKILRVDQKNPHPPVPVYTIAKPCNPGELVTLVKKALS